MGSRHSRYVSHSRPHHGGLRAAHHGLSRDFRHSCHPEDRPWRVSDGEGVGVHGGTAALRDPALHSYERIRHGGCDRPRRAHRLSDGGIPFQGRAQGREACAQQRGEPACGDPVGGLRSGRHAGAGARHSQDLSSARWREPACGDPRAGGDDPPIHHQCIGNGAARRAARI